MARKAQYTEALPVYVTPERRAAVRRMADKHDVSQAEVVRYCFEHGFAAAEKHWPTLG